MKPSVLTKETISPNYTKIQSGFRISGKKAHCFDSMMQTIQETINKAVGSMYELDHCLIDQDGYFWLTEKCHHDSGTSRLYILTPEAQFLHAFLLNGRPSVFQYEQTTIIACEKGTETYVYVFDTKNKLLMDTHRIEGFLWDITAAATELFVALYDAASDEAKLAVISGNGVRDITLDKNCYPTQVKWMPEADQLYVTLSPVRTKRKGKILALDISGETKWEAEIPVHPRQLFTGHFGLAIRTLNPETGGANGLLYFDQRTGRQTLCSLPVMKHIKPEGDHLLLYSDNKDYILYWSHDLKKVTRMLHTPAADLNSHRIS